MILLFQYSKDCIRCLRPETTRPDLTRTLEIARRDLLDLGLRNTLLNYRPLRTKGVDVIDEKPGEVYRLLVTEEKSLTFLSGEAVDCSLTGPTPVKFSSRNPGDDRNGGSST